MAKSTRTNFRGVHYLGNRKYLARWKARCKKTGKLIDYRQMIEDCPSPQKAAAIRAQLIDEAENARAPAARTHLATFAASWLASKKKTLKPSSYARYEGNLDLHIVPGLGDYYMDAITPRDIVKWRDSFNDMQARTINSMLRVLRTLFKAAVVELDLPKNPASYVAALPEADTYSDEEPNSLTTVELALFLDATKRHRAAWYPLFATLAFTGCRISEVSALQWIDIDWPTETELGKIRVRRSHWKGHVSESTKTKRTRTVPLPQELADVLAAHKKELEARKAVNHELWVFPSTVGKPVVHASARNALLRVLKKIETEKLDVPNFSVHGLRRTLNDLLRQHASRETAKAIIGHTTDAMHAHYSTVRVAEKLEGVSNVLQLVRVPEKKAAT